MKLWEKGYKLDQVVEAFMTGSSRRESYDSRPLTPPVHTDPYTAVHDHYDLAHTRVIIGIYPMDSISLFERPLCMQ